MEQAEMWAAPLSVTAAVWETQELRARQSSCFLPNPLVGK